MTFVSLDSKQECFGVYKDGELFTEAPFPQLTRTWKPSHDMDSEIDYAYLYCGGKSLDEMCPEHLKPGWDRVNGKLKAFYTSFVEAKVSLDDNCFFDLVPKQFLLEYCEVKCKVIDYIFSFYEKPANYSFLRDLHFCLKGVEQRELKLAGNIESAEIAQSISSEKRKIFYKIKNKMVPRISYNMFGTRTGRLTVNKGYFPALTLDKTFRSILKPTNTRFLELDYNAAELRTFIALSGNEQPEGDIHSLNAEKLGVTRDEAKQAVLAWLYGSTRYDVGDLKDLYDKEKVLMEHYAISGVVLTPYGREICCDKEHALNYLLQSTTSDIVLKKMIEIENTLKNNKSFVSFCLHDSLIIDLAESESDVITDIVNIFSRTNFGDFPINVSIGKDFGNMNKVEI